MNKLIMDFLSLPKTPQNLSQIYGKEYVYVIINNFSDNFYIGKTCNPSKRWLSHKHNAKRVPNYSYFYNAMNKHGVENFEFLVLSSFDTAEEAYAEERKLQKFCIDNKFLLYNLIECGQGGKKYSEKEKLKHSERQKKWASTVEARKINSEAQSKPEVVIKKSKAIKKLWNENPEIWKTHQSDDYRDFHRKKMNSCWQNDEWRKKYMEIIKTPEHKAKLSAQRKNENNPHAKLNWDLVREIRNQYDNGLTTGEVWNNFPQFSYPTIRRVVSRRSWINHE